MKNPKKSYNASKNSKFKPGLKKRDNKCIVTFDDKDRQEYLTGFHKRKVERKKAAVAELQKKIKEEQKKVKEERHKTYMKMLKERTEALEEDRDDLEEAIIGTTESIQYDHPNHTVTVTTINDLDLTGPGSFFLGPAGSRDHGENEDDEEDRGEEAQEKMTAMPKKANNPILNKKIRNLSASLSSHTKSKKRKGKPKQEGKREQQQQRGSTSDKRHAGERAKTRPGRTTKKERRRRKGNRRYQD